MYDHTTTKSYTKEQIIDVIETRVRDRVKGEVEDLLKEEFTNVSGFFSIEGDYEIEYEAEVELIDIEVEITVLRAIKKQDLI